MLSSFYEQCKTLLTDADALAKLAAFKPDIIIGDMFTDCRYTLLGKPVPYMVRFQSAYANASGDAHEPTTCGNRRHSEGPAYSVSTEHGG